RKMREQRQREKAVRDGAAIGRACGARPVDMDPLEVVDRLGEGVDALLRDLDPGRDRDLLADAVLERTDAGRVHFCTLRRMLATSSWRRRAPAGSALSSSALTSV